MSPGAVPGACGRSLLAPWHPDRSKSVSLCCLPDPLAAVPQQKIWQELEAALVVAGDRRQRVGSMPNGTSDPRYTKRKDEERDGVDLSGIDIQFTIDLSQSLFYKTLTPVVAVSSGRARALEARIFSRRSG
jgi:hypothetical protein